MRGIDGSSISVADESAIIVWNSAKKVQHFIRRAAFDTKSPDFGHLVPTPTKPQTPFQTVEDQTFRTAESWLRPKVVYQERLKFDPILCCLGGCTSSPGKGGAAPLGVRVLHEQTVGGFDVNVLEADDAEELSQWIKKHGFSDDPELYEWLKPYVANKWKITAFRISRDPKSGGLATTKAVRMSFETDRPFFPYREPEVKEKKDQPKNAFKPRLLRVLFVSNERMDGTRGNSAWHAQVKWSDEISDAQRRQLARDTGLKDDDLPAKAWLTSFEDSASPRPGTEEVYFESAKDQTPIRPQVIQYNDVWIPLDVVILGVIVLFVVVSAAFVMWKKRA